MERVGTLGARTCGSEFAKLLSEGWIAAAHWTNEPMVVYGLGAEVHNHQPDSLFLGGSP